MKLLTLLLCILCGCCWADVIDDVLPFIIQVESGGDPHAVSDKGAIGLCQITPIVLCEYNNENRKYVSEVLKDGEIVNLYYYEPNSVFVTDDLYEPEYNVKIATWYLYRLRDHYLKENYTLERLLASWNGGITRLRKVDYDVSKMPRETRTFVRKVIKLYKASH